MGAKYLILTSSGGGGHLSVANAEKTRLINAGVSTDDIKLIDITGLSQAADNLGQPWIPTIGIPGTGIEFFSAKANIEHWNHAQRMGGLKGVQKLKKLVKAQPVAEAIQGPSVESHLNQFLKDNPEINTIIDTQALSTARIAHVIGEHNRSTKTSPPIQLRKIISEFVTEKAVHYFKPLSCVSEADAEYLTVATVNPPLVIGHESSESFYTRNGIGHLNIEVTAEKPLRPEFFRQESDRAGTIATLKADGEVQQFKKQADDTIITLTLGSQGSVAVLDYIDAFIDQVLAAPPKTSGRTLFFIAAGKDDGSRNTLYAKTQAHLKERMQALKTAGIRWPRHAEIVPLGFQNADHMASLFKHSDTLISRSGGISSMEIEETHGVNPNRKVYIHTEAQTKRPLIFPSASTDAAYDAFIEGTVPWEGGNAEYLIQKIDASLTSAQTIDFHLTQQKKLPDYDKSLLKLVREDKLSKHALPTIDAALKAGANPNTAFITDLPPMAYAKDFETLRLMIQYGGQLTPAVENHLYDRDILSHDALQTLREIAAFQQAQIQEKGYTPLIHAEFYHAIETQDIAVIQGLLYRHPLLAFSAQPSHQNQQTKRMIAHIKGTPMLSLQLAHPSSKAAQNALGYQLYLQQGTLNQKDDYGKTPLAYCRQPKLRALMVFLGADPSHLSPSVTRTERARLEKLFEQSKRQTEYLQSLILQTYINHKDDADAFYAALQTDPYLHPLDLPKAVLSSVFQDLHETQNQIDAMHIIERLIHWIKYLFSADILTEQSQLESNKLLFYSTKNDNTPEVPNGPDTPQLH